MVLPLLNFDDGQKVFGNSVSERLTQVQMCPQKSSQLRIAYILLSNTPDEQSSGGRFSGALQIDQQGLIQKEEETTETYFSNLRCAGSSFQFH